MQGCLHGQSQKRHEFRTQSHVLVRPHPPWALNVGTPWNKRGTFRKLLVRVRVAGRSAAFTSTVDSPRISSRGVGRVFRGLEYSRSLSKFLITQRPLICHPRRGRLGEEALPLAAPLRSEHPHEAGEDPDWDIKLITFQ